ncbi:MAG: hypothetical protein LBJ00_14070 [Planctomycetaceae bacterium]|nr:hypothetical protein [Planctomycetaceae bacterium]
MNNRFALLRLPNALRYRFTVASGISKQLEYNSLEYLLIISRPRKTCLMR